MTTEEIKVKKVLASVSVSSIAKTFWRTGYYSSLSLFSEKECEKFLRQCKQNNQPAPVDWPKGHAATNRYFYEFATENRILDIVKGILGDDVMLWGARLIQQKTNGYHQWMTDIETSANNARAVSLLICLEFTSDEKLIKLVPGSHTFGTALQMVASESFMGSGFSDADVEEWAKTRNKESRILTIPSQVGDVCLLDGRMWHSCLYPDSDTKSTSLLLQYATPDTAIRIPDVDYKDWPARYEEVPQPPCIMVHGNARKSRNKIVTAPTALGYSKPRLSTWIRQLTLPLAEDSESGWKSYRIFHGSSTFLPYFGCYVSVLSPGACPHIPHAHSAEEVLVVLDGYVELVIADRAEDMAPRMECIGPGNLVYYPSNQHHSLSNPGHKPATYMMFKWESEGSHTRQVLETGIFSFKLNTLPGASYSFEKRLIFEGRTRCLTKLHAHFSTLQAGASYQPHVDAYDVGIVVLSGRVETLDHEVHSNGIILYGAGESHGLRNIGNNPATYLVLEFHGPARKVIS